MFNHPTMEVMEKKAAQLRAMSVEVGIQAQTNGPSSIGAAINDLAMRISSAEVNFERLADRLRPVRCMAPQVQPGKNDLTGTQLPQCELEDMLLNLASRVSALAGQIGEVSSQVCV